MSDKEQKRIFSKNLNYFLSLNNKTQKEVANAINVSPQTFNTWCQGIAIPRIGKVQLLADYFNIPKTALIDELSSNDFLAIKVINEGKYQPYYMAHQIKASTPGYSEEIENHFMKLLTLSKEQQQVVLNMIDSLCEANSKIKDIEPTPVSENNDSIPEFPKTAAEFIAQHQSLNVSDDKACC